MLQATRAPRSLFALAVVVGGLAACAEPTPTPTPTPTPLVEWPNADSAANSDRWLVEHHDEIDILRPRIVVLDFVNGVPLTSAQDLAARTIAGLQESSRPHGYRDQDAVAALQPELATVVDLRDTDSGTPGNSSLYPREDPVEGAWGLDYEALFTPEFAARMDLRDPDQPDEGPLDLCAAIERGLVHEVWIYGWGDTPDVSAAEILEQKPVYDANGNPTGEMNRCAGNGCFDDEDNIPCARTVRIGWLNSNRGPGCYLESLGHGFESIGAWNPDTIPALSTEFIPFANYSLDERYGVPADSWYDCPYDGPCLSYPTTSSVTYAFNGNTGTVEDYDPGCGNVHWPPNGRAQYDLDNTAPVLTSCEQWGEEGGARTAFTNAAFAPYRVLAPDCMGAFLVWWRQNWPGPHSPKVGGDGNPMKSWWPYLYY